MHGTFSLAFSLCTPTVHFSPNLFPHRHKVDPVVETNGISSSTSPSRIRFRPSRSSPTPTDMLRLIRRLRPPLRPFHRRFSSLDPSQQQRLKDQSPPPPPVLHTHPVTLSPHHPSSLSSPSPSPPSGSLPVYVLAGTLISATALAAAYLASPPTDRTRDKIAADFEQTLEKSRNSVFRIFDHMRQTGAAAAVLWKSLASVMSSANQEVRSGFQLRVAALLADISAANEARRVAIVSAGSGAVVDWLLERVACPGSNVDHSGTQAEAARALAHLIADPQVCKVVLGRPHAVPNLLRFIFSFQPKRSKKHLKHSSLGDPDFYKGRSMLVATLMDIITSNCDYLDKMPFQSMLPGKADIGDIAAALAVVEQGAMHLDDHGENGDTDDGDRGIRGIGIKILGGTTVINFSETKGSSKLSQTEYNQFEPVSDTHRRVIFSDSADVSEKLEKLSPAVPGLWDDLQREHVAVPFAVWALANWALASDLNRTHIQELDSDGHAILTALKAPERTVKWHGSLVARSLLDDWKLPLAVSVPDWCFSLLSTAFHASKEEDVPLAQLALSTFVVSVERSDDAKELVMQKGLHLMRGIAKSSEKHKQFQELLARVLELFYNREMHLSLEESERWSSILLCWVFDKSSTESMRLSATKILSFLTEDHGPNSVPISQGWLTLMLDELLKSSQALNKKGNTPPKTDKTKTQIEQSNAQLATQVANQLANAVIRLAGKLDIEPDSSDTTNLADFLSIEPFATSVKNMKKNNLPKFDIADAAFATLKGIKALTDLCAEDAVCQKKIADFGALCLLRRFLLADDYEKLAANEAYATSRGVAAKEQSSVSSGDSYRSDITDPSSVRVPPTAHIRRHAARLVNILSLLPNIKKDILTDEVLCKWLEDCACGKVPCSNDPKLQSYARAILLNTSCVQDDDFQVVDNVAPATRGDTPKVKCPQYEDMIFLLSPQSSHWKPFNKEDGVNSNNLSTSKPAGAVDHSPSDSGDHVVLENSGDSRLSGDPQESRSGYPLMDVVFIHGLRGGPFNSWRIAENKSSTTSKAGLVENIDQDAGKQGTCWPSEWLAADFPDARFFTLKYKTNLTQWTGASLPLQEVSSMLLRKLTNASIGERPVVFVTHSMGGLVVKEMLHQAMINNLDGFIKNTVGLVFYSCPHFGSKLADMPWRMGLVLRPAPTIGELRSGSPRLVELNDLIRNLHKKGLLEVLSFSETQVTPIVEGYGGWAFRLEIVAMESAYPGFGELIVLDNTDHINSCKPVNRTDPSYAKTLELLEKLKEHLTRH